MEVTSITGHMDLCMLSRYTHLKAEDLREVAETTGCLVHAYVLMTNHVNAQCLTRPCQRNGSNLAK